MITKLSDAERAALTDELRKLRHLQKTRMLSLDDGGFVRNVVSEMNARIREIEHLLTQAQQPLD